MESGGGSRRRRSHSGEKLDSANLRDFLRVKEDDDGRNSYSGLTLSAVLGSQKIPSPAQVNRTLLDIIRDDPNSSKESKKSWKAFKDKLRLRRAGAAWTSTIPIPTSDVPFQNSNRMMTRRQSTRFPTTVVNSDDPTSESTHPGISSSSSTNEGDNSAEMNSMPGNRAMMLRHNSSRIPSLAANRYGRGADGSTSSNTRDNGAFENAGPQRRVRYMEEEDEEEEEEEAAEEAAGESDESAEGAEEGGEPPVRMSLMALLAETDREMGLDGSTYTMDDEEEEEEEEEQREQGSGGAGEYNNCCVCMVRHKGSAFIPCGHTFCRLCSRELWVQRGNCPLCNGFILEILDIF